MRTRTIRGGTADRRREVRLVADRARRRAERPMLITGGAGFIGSNLADSLLTHGSRVMVFDNLSRPGVAGNLDWLRAKHGGRLMVRIADVRDPSAIGEAVEQAGAVVHLAGQVAVTESLARPLDDFAVNAGGTLQLLEALRRTGTATPFIFASTNKVYGALEGLALEPLPDRYAPADAEVARWGIGEDRPLQFCTPYGCSKGAADQYVLDYAKCFGLPTVVLRMSCIYGPRQLGTEDQGWVAHFLIRAMRGEGITLFGDGRQVRDVLHVADAVRAYRMVLDNVERLAGRAFNLGGGSANTVSLLMMLQEIERLLGRPVTVTRNPMRPGDQLYFVADTRRLAAALQWRPHIAWSDGLADLRRWLAENRSLVGIPAAETAWSVPA